MIDTALDASVETLLRNSSALEAAMGGRTRLYLMSAPNDAPFPHIIHGEAQILDISDNCSEAYEIYVTLRVWTQDNEGGPTETSRQSKHIAGVVRGLLKGLSITGFRVVEHRPQPTNTFADLDGLSAQAVVSSRYWVEASA